MNIPPEEIAKLLEAARPNIVQSLKDELTKGISYDVKQAASQQIAAHVKQWITENLIPDVTALLVESKEGLMGIAIPFAEAMCAELVKRMISSLSENLKSSYSRREIFGKMFN